MTFSTCLNASLPKEHLFFFLKNYFKQIYHFFLFHSLHNRNISHLALAVEMILRNKEKLSEMYFGTVFDVKCISFVVICCQLIKTLTLLCTVYSMEEAMVCISNANRDPVFSSELFSSLLAVLANLLYDVLDGNY